MVSLSLVQTLDESGAHHSLEGGGQREQFRDVLAVRISRVEKGTLTVAAVKAPGPVNRSRLPSSLCVIISRTPKKFKAWILFVPYLT